MNIKNAKKLRIESEASMFAGYYFSGNAVKQTLSIHSDGRVFWNQYYLTDKYEKHRIEYHRFKIDTDKARKILEMAGDFLMEPDMVCACDAGSWFMLLETESGEKYYNEGPLVEMDDRLTEIGRMIRLETGEKKIWAFDWEEE